MPQWVASFPYCCGMFVNARAIIERVSDGSLSAYVQWRTKPNEPRVLELPGGRVGEFESLLSALRREVVEETGMTVTHIIGADSLTLSLDTVGDVECVPVYAAYQTVRGPVDSMGVYFRCQAEGSPKPSEESERGVWMSPRELYDVLNDQHAKISWVDRAGLQHYLSDFRETRSSAMDSVLSLVSTEHRRSVRPKGTSAGGLYL